MIHFGLRKQYKDTEGDGDARLTTGTLRYMSINNHMVENQSRKFFFKEILYLLFQRIPEQEINAQSLREKAKLTLNLKKQSKIVNP